MGRLVREVICAVREWPHCKQFLSVQKNIANDPLVDRRKRLLPPHHIRLGQLANSMKAMNRNRGGFRCPVQKFPRINGAKIKEGTFIDPQLKDVMDDKNFL
jgi:hypothetical protein